MKSCTPALLLCAALLGCTTAPPQPTQIDNATPLGADVVQAVSPTDFETGRFVSSRGTALPYRLLRPSKFSPGTHYPLVLQLHGSGGIGSDNLGQLERLAKSWAMPEIRERYQAFVLIPQFPIRSANYGPISPEQFALASPVLDDALELIAEFSASQAVDRSRIYATGFSMGASATWLLPTLAPDVFAGIVPISGVAPANSHATALSKMPVLAMHGDADPVNPITADRRFVEALIKQGAQQVSLRTYKGLVHQPPADSVPGFWWRDWLFSQRLQR